MRKHLTDEYAIQTRGFEPCALDALAFSGRIVAG